MKSFLPLGFLIFFFFLTLASATNFTVTPSVIYLNFTNNYNTSFNITVNVYDSLYFNLSAFLKGNFFQEDFYVSEYWGTCFYEKVGYGYFAKLNISTDKGVSYQTNPVGSGNTTEVFVYFNPSCPAGRYHGFIEIIGINASDDQSVESFNLTVIVDNLISTENEIKDGIGIFKGKLHAFQNYATSYYFNTSIYSDLSFIYISLTWQNYSQDINLFLLDENGNVVSKSANYGKKEEIYYYGEIPPNKTWEILIYGNLTQPQDYNLTVQFSTLKLINQTSQETIYLLNLPTLKPGNTTRLNLTLSNPGILNFSDVKLNISVFKKYVFNGTDSANFSFFVPSFAKKIISKVEWYDLTPLNLSLFNPSGEIVSSIKRNYIPAFIQEEILETTSVEEGFWEVRVLNETEITNYSVETLIEVEPSLYFSTNFISENLTSNSSKIFELNLSIPSTAIPGEYEGYLLFYGSIDLKVPITFNVSSSFFLINNSFQSSVIEIDDNIGFNKTISFNVLIKNLGNDYLIFDKIENSTYLNCSTYFVNLTFELPSQIDKNYELPINLTINTLQTGNKECVYIGWINFTSSGSTPYQTFSLILKLNLTRFLLVKIHSFQDREGHQTNLLNPSQNVSIYLDVFYLNKTLIESLTLSNFSDFFTLTFSNLSRFSYSIDALNSIDTHITTGASPYYKINLSIPSIPGGLYRLTFNVTHWINDIKYEGYGSYFPVIINQSGFYMNSSTRSIMLDVGEESKKSENLTVYVYNFGPLTSNTTIHLDLKSEECDTLIKIKDVYPKTSWSNGYEKINSTTVKFINHPAFNEGVANLTWIIEGIAKGNCVLKVKGNSVWFDDTLLIDVSVENTTVITTTTTFTTETTTTTTQLLDFEIVEAPTLVLLQQNSSNSTLVKVKNTGNVEQMINLSIEGINSTWFGISPTFYTIQPNETKAFNVTFSIEMVEVKEYKGKFKVFTSNKSKTKDFTLRVLPAQFNETYIENMIYWIQNETLKLKQNLTQLEKQGINVSIVKQMLEILEQNLNMTLDYLKQGDYYSAYLMIDDLLNMLNKTQLQLFSLTPKKDYTNYILAAVIIAIILILVYLFWPVKEESTFQTSGKKTFNLKTVLKNWIKKFKVEKERK